MVRKTTFKQQFFLVYFRPDPLVFKKVAVRSRPCPAKISFNLHPGLALWQR